MKLFLKILFIIFIGTLITGFLLKRIQHPNADVIIGLDILFLAFIFMPLFIYYRYKKGKYKKYVIDPKSKNPFKVNQRDL